jgi:signal transduction histidine kinase
MANLSIQTFFLFYSALSFLAAIVIAALFWKKNDRSANLWIASCVLTAIATAVTVNRGSIPSIISFSLMVSFEALSLFFLSESLKRLSVSVKVVSYSKLTWLVPSALFVLTAIDSYRSGAAVTPFMTAAAAFTFGFANLYCFYFTQKIGKQFSNRLFLNFIGLAALAVSLMSMIRGLNVLSGYSAFAFDLKSYNIVIWFLTALLCSIRNLAYIVLRLHLGFAEHNLLNNMNVSLSNILDERNRLIFSLENFNRTASINALASTIAHEINQPLGALRINAELAGKKIASGATDIALLEKINKEAIEDIDRASAIVRSLVNLANRKTNQPVVLELVAATKEVVEVSRTRLRDEGVVVEINSPDRCYARVNPTEWQQVLINLLNNAIDSLQVSSKTTKQIVITLRQEADFIEMTIQDNGVGIPVGQEEKIFELLVTSKESGSGVGLWLTKDIIKRYQGEIFAKNIDDSGARFTVLLPTLNDTPITVRAE